MKIAAILKRVRAEKPLVHHITNWVTIYDCAAVVKIFGASPVMAHALEEAGEMTRLFAGALVLNIGTLTRELVDAMIEAGGEANGKNIPVVLDACGAGATAFRNLETRRILDNIRVDILKGNSSEIASIAGENIVTRGVDATSVEKDLATIAKHLAAESRAVVVITGSEDIIANPQGEVFRVANGHPVMGQIVGTGCMAASVIGTFAAVEKNLALAAIAGLACFEIAAEKAARTTALPGSWKTALFDCIATLDPDEVDGLARIQS